MFSSVTEFWQRYDRTLGGLEMQLRLRDFLGKKFNEMKKTSTDVFKNPRAMAKLFKEAGRLKNILSANADHFAQVSKILCINWMAETNVSTFKKYSM
jgi:molecular chaperone DnaK (HSP70)